MAQTRDKPRSFLNSNLSGSIWLSRQLGPVTLGLQREIDRYGISRRAESVPPYGVATTVNRSACDLVYNVVLWVLELNKRCGTSLERGGVVLETDVNGGQNLSLKIVVGQLFLASPGFDGRFGSQWYVRAIIDPFTPELGAAIARGSPCL